MNRFKRYERYKDSGIEWIGEIPEHWEIIKLRRYVREHKQGYYTTEDYVDDGVKLARITDINDNGDIFYENMPFVDISEKDEKAFALRNGDVLFARSGTIGRFGIVKNPERSVFASYLIKFRFSPKLKIEYLRYVFLSSYFKQQLISTLHGGANQNIHAENIKEQIIVYPCIEEQTTIANFLDQKTAEIDGLIADKEKLIELLQEKRQSIITEVVTKGLNPNVRMKDSGIEWIGEIPEHWNIIKMKYLLSPKKHSIKAGPFGSQLKNDDMISGNIKVYNQKTVLDNDFKSGDYYIESYKYEELRAFEVFSGDLLVTTRGTIGKTAIVPKDAEKGILHPCLIKIRLNPDKVLNEYVNVIFNNTKIVTNQIMLESNATTIDVIYTDTLKNLVLPIPPLEEQKSIIDFVDATIDEIDGVISSIKIQIQKLKEYRQSLIFEVVTGKIDVRVFNNKKEVS
ncbi:MAG TPA: hypothetical protein GX514_07045 [Thermoanaerobacterales bacterium]|nr:hypothetical protein [Thermoanaerobacterales bacterium]